MLKAAWPLGTLAALLMAVGGYVVFDGKETKGPMRYRTTAVSRGTMVSRITATGIINPLLSVLVGTQVTGRIKSLHADFSSVVKAGDVIARIDPSVFQARRDQAEASLITAKAAVASAKATLEQKRRELDRATSLLQQNFISQNEVDLVTSLYQAALAQMEVASAQVRQAEALLRAADLDLKYTVIRAPVDGIVIARTAEVGQTVTASFQTPNLFLIAQDLAQMQIDTNVSEADIGGIAPGNEAEFHVDAYPTEVFHGIVKQVRLAPLNIQNVVTYNVVIQVENKDVRLKPGMTAQVNITVFRRDDVLRLPSAALRYTPSDADRPKSKAKSKSKEDAASDTAPEADKGGEVVWKVGSGGSPEAVPLQVGMSDAQYVEVLEGALKEGDEIIIGVEAARKKKSDPLPPGFAPKQKKGKSRDGGL